MSTTWDIHQQVFALSMFSNALGSYKGTEESLQGLFQERLQAALSIYGLTEWSTAWGPRVWKREPGNILTSADNVWFIAHNPNAVINGRTSNVYVVSIADSITIYDWVVEDFQVGSVVDLKAWIASGLTKRPTAATNVDDHQNAYISMGTAVGLFTVLDQVSGTSPAAGSILQFLQTLPPNALVIFAGHSLGGALSTALALALIEAGVLNARSVLTYPTAAASPGNANFARTLHALLPMTFQPGSAAYETWNGNIFNVLDIVPQAWSLTDPTRNLHNIATIYGQLPPVLDWVTKHLVALAIGWAVKSGIQYQPLEGRSWDSKSVVIPQTISDFKADASREHTQAYMDYANVKLSNWDLFPPAIVDKFGVQRKTVEEIALGLSVLSLLSVLKGAS